MSCSRSSSSNVSRNGNVRCYCELECYAKTAQTAKNKGRKYYGCPRFRDVDGGCGFFVWVDSSISGGFSSKKEENEPAVNASLEAKIRNVEVALMKAEAKIETLKVDANRNLLMLFVLFFLVCVLGYMIAGK